MKSVDLGLNNFILASFLSECFLFVNLFAHLKDSDLHGSSFSYTIQPSATENINNHDSSNHNHNNNHSQ